MDSSKSKKRSADDAKMKAAKLAKKSRQEIPVSKPPVEKQRKKKVKDKDAIKKPTSAYIYFTSAHREKFKKEGKAMPKAQDMAKLCGEVWKTMDDNDKKPFQALADKDKERYHSQMKTQPSTNDKKKKDPNMPKRPQTAYFLFLEDFRKEMKGKVMADGAKIPSLAGERWREMNDDDKQPYQDKVVKDKTRYLKEMAEYKLKYPVEENAKSKKKEKPVKAKPVKAAAKKPPPPSDSDESDEEESDESEEEVVVPVKRKSPAKSASKPVKKDSESEEEEEEEEEAVEEEDEDGDDDDEEDDDDE